jgi:hypothetical protein
MIVGSRATVRLIAGLAIVLGHNVWSGGALPVMVTLVGWLILVRGLLLLVLSPSAAVDLFTGLRFEQLFYLYATLSLVFGAYLDLLRVQPNIALERATYIHQQSHLRRTVALNQNSAQTA